MIPKYETELVNNGLYTPFVLFCDVVPTGHSFSCKDLPIVLNEKKIFFSNHENETFFFSPTPEGN